MAEISISVVVPTYNRSASLDRMLTSLDAQEGLVSPVEVIVVDDGSTDDTGEVVRRHQGVTLVTQANSGPARARNAGWRRAAGDVVLFTDDDTVVSSTWVAEVLAAFAASPDLVGVGGDIEPLVDSFLAEFVQLERLVHHGLVGSPSDRFGPARYLVTANAAFRRTALQHIDGFDERFPFAAGEDTDLGMRVVKAGGRLEAVEGAMVLHDHRISVRGLMRTYRKHGRARVLLGRFHPDAGVGAAARSMLGPRYWVGRYRYYRSSVPAAKALAYLGLRLAGLANYWWGMISENRRR